MKFYTLDGYITAQAATDAVAFEWPDTYLHVTECRSGEQWICPIRGNEKLDLKALIKKWAKAEYGGELVLDGNPMPRLQGDYYAAIMTDHRAPDSGICWTGGGFYLKGVAA